MNAKGVPNLHTLRALDTDTLRILQGRHRTPTQPPLEDDNEPHAVRTTLARQGRTPGVNLTTDHGTVFVPCWALPDLRRRLLVAQGRLATVAPAPSTRGRRRGPQNGS